MAHSLETRTAVRSLYVFKRLNCKAIAKRLKLRDSTVARWKHEARDRGDDWDKARAAHQIAGDGAQAIAVRFMDDFMHLLQNTIDDIKADPKMKPQLKVEALSRLADAYNKAMAGVKRSMPELNELAVAMEVVQRLVKFVQGKYPQHARALVEILDPFASELAKHYG